MKHIFAMLLLSVVFILSCHKTTNTSSTVTPPPSDPITKIAPDGFTYSTSKTISISVSTLTNDNKALSDVQAEALLHRYV
jgi:PBP1b-binding outer membrane lipoprotein LpoB